jgi:hypothetical protein
MGSCRDSQCCIRQGHLPVVAYEQMGARADRGCRGVAHTGPSAMALLLPDQPSATRAAAAAERGIVELGIGNWELGIGNWESGAEELRD